MNDGEILEFAKDFREGILDGDSSEMMCFAVCAPLETLLNMYGVDCELIEGSVGNCNHYWLELSDGRILDPTADQFNNLDRRFPEVYLGAKPAGWSLNLINSDWFFHL